MAVYPNAQKIVIGDPEVENPPFERRCPASSSGTQPKSSVPGITFIHLAADADFGTSPNTTSKIKKPVITPNNCFINFNLYKNCSFEQIISNYKSSALEKSSKKLNNLVLGIENQG